MHQVVFIELLLPPRINRPETRTENTTSLASIHAGKRCVNVSHAVSHIFLLYPVFEVETSMAESLFAVHLSLSPSYTSLDTAHCRSTVRAVRATASCEHVFTRLARTGATHVETLSQPGSLYTCNLRMTTSMEHGVLPSLTSKSSPLRSKVKGVRHMVNANENFDLPLRGRYSSRRCI